MQLIKALLLLISAVAVTFAARGDQTAYQKRTGIRFRLRFYFRHFLEFSFHLLQNFLLFIICALLSKLGAKYLAEKALEEGVITLKSGMLVEILKTGSADGKSPKVSCGCISHISQCECSDQ